MTQDCVALRVTTGTTYYGHAMGIRTGNRYGGAGTRPGARFGIIWVHWTDAHDMTAPPYSLPHVDPNGVAITDYPCVATDDDLTHYADDSSARAFVRRPEPAIAVKDAEWYLRETGNPEAAASAEADCETYYIYMGHAPGNGLELECRQCGHVWTCHLHRGGFHDPTCVRPDDWWRCSNGCNADRA